MKNLLLLAILFFNFSILIAQTVFAPSGAKWTYGFDYIYEGTLRDGYETITYTGDTIIDNIEMKVLARNSFVKTTAETIVSTFEGNYIIYQEGEKVFDKSGSLLYDFLLEIGDTVANIPSFNEEAKLIIIDKYNVDVNGFSTIEYKSKIDCGVGAASGDSIIMFNSIIAAQGYFLLGYNHCVWDIAPNYHLRCYEDDTIGFYQVSEEDCEQINYILANQAVGSDMENTINISPNPATDKIHISGKGYFDILFYSLDGEVLFTKNNIFEKADLSLSDYPKGIYFVKMRKGNRMVAKKIIKQ